ncbi:MAG: hypothetical protein APR54_02470 [Candidatus Cloacimonas sp. SDB]|nr:MAG: hypothetical protein APR54_02470 [Candidatus Cloacimonas sp. SDB]
MNQSKIYILPDGEEIDLSKIKSIGTLKSVRSKDFKSLGYWCFTIVFKDETSQEIQEGYFYSDLGKAKIELQMIRVNILKSLI